MRCAACAAGCRRRGWWPHDHVRRPADGFPRLPDQPKSRSRHRPGQDRTQAGTHRSQPNDFADLDALSTSCAVGHAWRISSIERRPAWQEPLSTIQNTRRPEHPPRRGVGLAAHHLLDQRTERCDPGLGLHPAHQPGSVHVVGAEVGQGAVAAVLELHTPCASVPGWLFGVASGQRLELGLLIGADHVLVGAELDPAPEPLV